MQNPLGRAQVIEDTKQAATEALEYRGFLPEELLSAWSTRGDDYFLRERPEDIAWHTEAIADHDVKSGALVLVRQASDSPIANATQIFVHTVDAPDTFARICAALESLDYSIHDARIYSDTDGSTLDTFFVLKNNGSTLDAHPDNAVEIKQAIQHSLHHATLRTISRHTPRTAKAFTIPTTVDFSQDDSGELTILEVTTADRPGLMARLGSVMSRYAVSIQGAKIQTLGERVEDTFFLADAAGGQLTDATLVEQLKNDLIAELDGLTREPDKLPSGHDI